MTRTMNKYCCENESEDQNEIVDFKIIDKFSKKLHCMVNKANCQTTVTSISQDLKFSSFKLTLKRICSNQCAFA